MPLIVATGAGAEMRRSLGTAVFSGMLGVTVFGIFLTPVFFYVIEGLGESEFFARSSVRRAGSVIASGLLGSVFGFLLGALGAADAFWAAPVGAAIGVLIMLALLQLNRLRDRGTNGSDVAGQEQQS